jgi:hypothetical protein
MKLGNSRIASSLAIAHRAHHRANGEPYGMLFPWLTMSRNGSRPSQVPVDQ